mmetsp:Transcript_7261/g.11590  ORF Transcript_7261/g.11590 Transcript_7261/m.11590 type:complete len:496 (-) Transcript_7261:952-2439(-)|eukprot:CAMPEP_0203754626 /NCGR_PEP_ID=MMETSP0098-20131031/8207_1 /ASSEMBLY_ACC=CAM_ASM_000208 /TAXON_ID=96639 /ORGANISM=" , Strain NY0313808BC1" /LENGTH=495 /DNA_ID=CAMNT_0050645733 /DNA_START=679 /DNA_END=2166 /DNA_ORIENTATION=-
MFARGGGVGVRRFLCRSYASIGGCRSGSILDVDGDLVVGVGVGCFDGGGVVVDGDLLRLDGVVGGQLSLLFRDKKFKGEAGTFADVVVGGVGGGRRLYFGGLGDRGGASILKFGKLAGEWMLGRCIEGGVDLGFVGGGPTVEQARLCLSSVVGVTDLLKKDEEVVVHPVNFPEDVGVGCSVGLGVRLCRDLVNLPSNVVTPSYLAGVAEDIASVDRRMSLSVFGEDECIKRGMGLFVGVSSGSEEEAKFIDLTFTPDEYDKTIAIVGKGVTFDSGGYNLKVGGGSLIELMKFDMGGAGATLGAARAVSMFPELARNVKVHFIVAACENMISGKATRPGDVLTASNGKTVEVGNTDAEGRLTLADAMVYAQQVGAEEVVTIATLTGACVVALGDDIAGLLSNDDGLASRLSSGPEYVHRLPLFEGYKSQLESKCADLSNVGVKKGGGAITAGLFLQNFVEDGVKWGHLDIAGPVFDVTATGFGVHTLVHYLRGSSA